MRIPDEFMDAKWMEKAGWVFFGIILKKIAPFLQWGNTVFLLIYNQVSRGQRSVQIQGSKKEILDIADDLATIESQLCESCESVLTWSVICLFVSLTILLTLRRFAFFPVYCFAMQNLAHNIMLGAFIVWNKAIFLQSTDAFVVMSSTKVLIYQKLQNLIALTFVFYYIYQFWHAFVYAIPKISRQEKRMMQELARQVSLEFEPLLHEVCEKIVHDLVERLAEQNTQRRPEVLRRHRL